MNYGLQPLKKKTLLEIMKGKIDYSHSKTFGSIDPSTLPEEYILESTILNQGFLPHCSSYSACAVQESQHGIPFDPEDYYKAEGVINGAVQDYGYDLRTLMATGFKYGFRPLSGGNPDDYKEGNYFSIDGDLDTFDNIRTALYMAKDQKKTAITGLMWYQEYLEAKNGIVDKNIEYKKETGLHAIKVAGFTTIDSVPYLVLQNSWGNGVGKNGLFYFSREIVNKELALGNFIWRTIDEEQQRIRTQFRILVLLKRVLELLKDLFHIQ